MAPPTTHFPKTRTLPPVLGTGKRQLMVYFSEAKLVYTSDLFALTRDGSLYLPQMAQEAVYAITRENLAVDRVYGMHYNPIPINSNQKPSTSTIAFANASGASCGKLCPTPLPIKR